MTGDGGEHTGGRGRSTHRVGPAGCITIECVEERVIRGLWAGHSWDRKVGVVLTQVLVSSV